MILKIPKIIIKLKHYKITDILKTHFKEIFLMIFHEGGVVALLKELLKNNKFDLIKILQHFPILNIFLNRLDK